MFRMMLESVFGCKTYTKYFSPNQVQDPNKPTERPLPGSWPECYGPMSREPDTTYFVKTHDGPEDNGMAIYIVRNGLAAIRSYQCYLRDFRGWNYSLEKIILGETRFRSWGWHLDAWNPLQRPNTLLLRYEDLVQHPDEQLDQVAAFIALRRQAAWVNEFDKWHAAKPKMFRAGPAVPPEAGITQEQQELFGMIHGDWMSKLGYGQARLANQRKLRAVLSERWQTLNTAPTNGNGQYRRLKKHWWVKLGRKTGLLSIPPRAA